MEQQVINLDATLMTCANHDDVNQLNAIPLPQCSGDNLLSPYITEPDSFRDVLHALIERLNDEGVMEAMFKLSEIERNSAYRK